MLERDFKQYLSSLEVNVDIFNCKSVRELQDIKNNLNSVIDEYSADANLKRFLYKTGAILLGSCLGYYLSSRSNMNKVIVLVIDTLLIVSAKGDSFSQDCINRAREFVSFIDNLLDQKIKAGESIEDEKSRSYLEEKNYFEEFGIKIKLIENKIKLVARKESTYLTMLNEAIEEFEEKSQEAQAKEIFKSKLQKLLETLNKEIVYEQGYDLILLFIKLYQDFQAGISCGDNIEACFNDFQQRLMVYKVLNADELDFRKNLILKAFLETLKSCDILNRAYVVEMLDESLVDKAISWLELEIDVNSVAILRKEYFFNDRNYLVSLVDTYFVFLDCFDKESLSF